MNRFVRRPLILLLVVVMLASSAMVNIPAYAFGRWFSFDEVPTVSYSVVEGVQYGESGIDEIVNILNLGDHPGGRVLIKEAEYSIDWFWFPTDFWWIIPIGWSEFGNVSIDGEPYVELLSTVGLPAISSPYLLVVIEADVDGHCTLDDVITKVELEVTVNEGPTAVDDDSDTVNEGEEVSVAVLENDSDSEDEISIVQLFDTDTTDTYTGTDFVVSGTTVIYTAPDEVAADFDISVDYQIGDHNYRNPKTAIATLTIGVKAVNDPPIANVDDVVTYVNVPVNLTPIANDEDIDNDFEDLSLVSVDIQTASLPNGALGVMAEDSVLFTPSENFSGDVFIDYVVSDGSATTTGLIKVHVNKPPSDNVLIANNDMIVMMEDDDATIDVTLNDIIEGDFDHITVTQPLHGTRYIDGREVRYVPDQNYVGEDYMTYTIFDKDQSRTGMIDIDVLPDNNNSRRRGDYELKLRMDYLSIDEGEIGHINVLENDNFYNGAYADQIEIVSGPYKGIATINAEGQITYTADPTVNSEEIRIIFWMVTLPSDVLFYEVTTQSGNKQMEMLMVFTSKVDNMKLQDDHRTIDEDSDEFEIDVLENDLVDEGVEWLRIVDYDDNYYGPYHGDARVENNKIYYKPHLNFNGTDSIVYKVKDGDGNYDYATLIITVLPMDDPEEELGGLTFPMNRGETLLFNVFEEESNLFDLHPEGTDSFFDVFGEIATIEVTTPSFGVTTALRDGSISFVPGDDHQGSIVFDIVITNIYGDTARVRVFVDVDLAIDEIAVYLYPDYDGYNEEYRGFFIQQYDDIDLLTPEDIEYGVVGTNPVTREWISVQTVQGYLDPDDDLDDGVELGVESYGTFLVTYYAGDDYNHTGKGGPRRLIVNQQPIGSVGPIVLPDDLFILGDITPEVAYDVETFFEAANFNILDYLYVYDFEEYGLNPGSPVVTIPEGLTIVVDDGSDDAPYAPSEVFEKFAMLAADDEEEIYTLTFTISDSMEGETTVEMKLLVKNNPPVMTIENDFIVYLLNEEYDIMEGVAATDVETPEETLEWDTYLDGFDIAVPGKYEVEYTVTDEAGLFDVGMVEIWVVTEPEVMIEVDELTMDFGGHFPTFTNVDVDFWPTPDLSADFFNWSSKRIRTYFRAYIETEVEVEALELVEEDLTGIFTPTETDTYTIYYEAKKVVKDGSDIIRTIITTETRTLHVTDVDLENYFYSSDFYNLFGDKYEWITDEDVETVGLFELFFSDLVKHDPETGEMRYVSLIGVEKVEESESNPSGFMRTVRGFDDLAVTYDGTVYGVKGDDFYKYDGAGSFEMIFSLDDLNIVWDRGPQIKSLTAGPRGELVFIVNGDELYIVDPNMLTPTGDGFRPGVEKFELEEDYYDVTDLTYNDDFTEIYGIGLKYVEEITSGSVDFEWGQDPYEAELFKLIPEEYEVIESDDVEEEPIDEPEMAIRYVYDSEFAVLLDGNYFYTGIVNIGNHLFLTKYQVSKIEEPDPQGPVPAEWIKVVEGNITLVEERGYNGALIDTDEMPDFPFYAATGAAANFEKVVTATPNPVTLHVGYGKVAADGEVDLNATVFPELSFTSTDIIWLVVGGDVTVDTNGFVIATAGNVSGVEYATVRATSIDDINLFDDVALTLVRHYPAPTPDSDPDPTPSSAPTPTIGVTLDTDAITLDYGETADPNFTSFDFTETVTGTTNKNVTWSLSDDTFVSVDANGLVTADGDIPVDTGDITVTLTVTTVVGGATATATIIFEEQTPLGAIEFFEPYVSGYSDGTFRASGIVTRAEVASMFARILKVNRGNVGTQKFADVSEGHWAYGSIQAMYNIGIFSGYLDGDGSRYFDPNAAISRGEIAQVFTNYWNLLDISVTSETVTPISDVMPDYWALAAINRIFNTGIFTGFDDGTFRPNDPTLRGQIVSMINRLIARPANEAGFGRFPDILPTSEFFGDIEAASQTFLKPQAD